jgi:hypothetical protein
MSDQIWPVDLSGRLVAALRYSKACGLPPFFYRGRRITMSRKRVDPHPLDYDWRFTSSTVDFLTKELRDGDCLLAGVPSLVDAASSSGSSRRVRLVDWQPNLGSYETVNINLADPLAQSFDIALVDPPWYPKEYLRWVTWVAQHLPPGGEILASLWPVETRPTASDERASILRSISDWADVDLNPGVLRYQVPHFEMCAFQAQERNIPPKPWRVGDLVRLNINKQPGLRSALRPAGRWHRFVWNDYQLALRVSPEVTGPVEIAPVPGAKGWIWPSVSRRAPGRDEITLWSSANEVAKVHGAGSLLKILMQWTSSGELCTSDAGDQLVQLCEQWNFPKSSLWRSEQWHHPG